MMQSKAYRRIAMLSGLCLFLLTITPLCSLNMLSYGSEVSSAVPRMTFPIELSESNQPESQFLAVQANDSDWVNVTPVASPPTRLASVMAYDDESDKVVLFGGSALPSPDPLNDTWFYDYNANVWINSNSTSAPPARDMASMVYDEESDIIILFGGAIIHGEDLGNITTTNDTWSFDVNSNTWTEMFPSSAPQSRCGCSVTYDSKSDLVILHGGFDGSVVYGDTWTFDFNSNTWTELNPVTSPGNRFLSSMVYDEDSELALLFGGQVIGEPYDLNDTWSYNSVSNTWTEMIPTNSPISRAHHAMVYDRSVQRTILFGGWDYDSVFDDTWSYNYNTNTWIEMNTPDNPVARHYTSMAYDTESNRTILFSGAGGTHYDWYSLEADTWSYKYQINPPSGPLNLQVTESGEDLVLAWDPPSTHPETPITGYNVYRGTSSEVYDLLAEVGNVFTYTDDSVTSNLRYYYVVTAIASIGEGAFSNEIPGMILTAIPDDGIFSFIAYGDTRGNEPDAVSSLHDDIVALYLQHDPELIINTGDMVNQGGESYQWPLFEDSISAVREADILYYCAVGNHEIYTADWGVSDEDYSTYLDYVDFSDVVDTTGETELYYSFDQNGIHFVFLNTVEEWDENVFTCSTAQMEWLTSDLETTSDDDVIVVSFHNPAYSIRENRPDRWAQAESIRDTFHSIFVDYDVDIVFNGHDHQYYRTVRDDIQYVVTGGGGAPLYDVQTEGTVWQEGDVAFSNYHYCFAFVSNSSVIVQVRLMDGTIPDTFSIEIPIPPSGYSFELVLALGLGVVLVIVFVVIVIKKKQ